MFDPLIIFQLVVLMCSVIIHEISHGYVAEYLGDSTARVAGRLTINPLKHLDLFGSVLLPLLLALAGQPIIGWAKPVPYNPYNLKDPKRGGGLIALAGPLSNLLIAFVLGLAVRAVQVMSLGATLQGALLTEMLVVAVTINVVLAIFNLLPIPPIDGSKVVTLILPRRWQLSYDAFWARVGAVIQENFIVFIIILFLFLSPILEFIFFFLRPIMFVLISLFTGFSL